MSTRSRRSTLTAALAGLALAALTASGAAPILAQQAPSESYGFGRPASPERIGQLDNDVRPDGTGLPPGSGTAAQGAAIFAGRCAGCHGAAGEGTRAGPALVGREPFRPGVIPTIGNFWPFATTVYDYTMRAMPFDAPGTLTPDELYAVTAWLLNANGLIGESDVMDASSLPRVSMPNAGAFIAPDPRPDVP